VALLHQHPLVPPHPCHDDELALRLQLVDRMVDVDLLEDVDPDGRTATPVLVHSMRNRLLTEGAQALLYLLLLGEPDGRCDSRLLCHVASLPAQENVKDRHPPSRWSW